MNIYHYNAEGILIGESDADESPLEPGVFLIPTMATDISPPKIPDNFLARFTSKEWVLEPIPTPEPAPATEPLTEPIFIYACSPWQIRKALNAQGLRQAVEDIVAASDDQGLIDGWEFATEFRSDDPFVISMGAAVGKSEEETRQLVEYAATL